MDLYEQIQQKMRELDYSVKQLRHTGTAFAQAERDYKVLLRQEVLKLRDAGTAVGVIDKIAYGIPAVAEARFKRDCTEAIYEANKEHLNVTKLMIRILEEELEREWGNAK